MRGTQAVADRDTTPRRRALVEYGHALRPTARQVEALRSYIRHGTHQDAARAIGVTERTLKAHLASLRQRLGVYTTAQAVYVLWLGYRDHRAECELETHDHCMPPISEVQHR
jgi:DNA-binding NarL/FixJ family response regulator